MSVPVPNHRAAGVYTASIAAFSEQLIAWTCPPLRILGGAPRRVQLRLVNDRGEHVRRILFGQVRRDEAQRRQADRAVAQEIERLKEAPRQARRFDARVGGLFRQMQRAVQNVKSDEKPSTRYSRRTSTSFNAPMRSAVARRSRDASCPVVASSSGSDSVRYDRHVPFYHRRTPTLAAALRRARCGTIGLVHFPARATRCRGPQRAACPFCATSPSRPGHS